MQKFLFASLLLVSICHFIPAEDDPRLAKLGERLASKDEAERQKAFLDATKIGKPAVPVLRKALAVERSRVPAACALLCIGPEASEAGAEVLAALLGVEAPSKEDARFHCVVGWAAGYDMFGIPDTERKTVKGFIALPAPSEMRIFKRSERMEQGAKIVDYGTEPGSLMQYVWKATDRKSQIACFHPPARRMIPVEDCLNIDPSIFNAFALPGVLDKSDSLDLMFAAYSIRMDLPAEAWKVFQDRWEGKPPVKRKADEAWQFRHFELADDRPAAQRFFKQYMEGFRTYVPDLKESLSDKQEGFFPCMRIKPIHMEALIEFLDSKDSRLREIGELLLKRKEAIIPGNFGKLHQRTTDVTSYRVLTAGIEAVRIGQMHLSPELRITLQSTDKKIAAASFHAIVRLGEAALLEVAATDPRAGMRKQALKQIAELDSASKEAAAVLTACLRDPDPEVASAAVDCLKAARLEAAPAASGLATLAKIANKQTFDKIFEVFKTLGPAGRDGVPGLLEVAKDNDRAKLQAVLQVLKGIGPEAKEAVPFLLKTYKEADPVSRNLAGSALKMIDMDAAKKAGVP